MSRLCTRAAHGHWRPQAPQDCDRAVSLAPDKAEPLIERANIVKLDIQALGHDGIAGHEIRIARSQMAGRFDVRWNGRVALAYAGDSALKHRFEAQLRGVPFGGFAIPEQMHTASAVASFRQGATRE